MYQLGAGTIVVTDVVNQKHCGMPLTSDYFSDQSFVCLHIVRRGCIIHREFQDDKIGLSHQQITVRSGASELGIRGSDSGIYIGDFGVRECLTPPFIDTMGITKLGPACKTSLRNGAAQKPKRQFAAVLCLLHNPF